MDFNKETVEYFSTSIRYNLSTYIDLYSLFISEYQKRIENFFKFEDTNADVEAFDFLNSLIEEASKIDDLIKMNKKYFYRIDHWEFVAFLDEIKNSLDTVDNTAKWTGSNKTKNNWRSISIQSNHVLNQHETLEEVVEDNYGGDYQNDWMKLSIENNLFEKDYTAEGGNNLLITQNVSISPKYFIRSVVDSLINERLYGLDLNRRITFSDDDLLVATYTETVKQSILILGELKRSDIPEYPMLGVDPNLGVGSNVGMLIYSSITRQLEDTFASDDTLTNFNVIDISYENTDLTVEYSIDTFFNNTIKSKITV